MICESGIVEYSKLCACLNVAHGHVCLVPSKGARSAEIDGQEGEQDNRERKECKERDC
jgi:hypothetical protein